MTPAIEYDFTQSPAAELAKNIERLCVELPGFQGAGRSRQMAQLALDQKPDIAVEIGVYGGRSLLPVAMAMKLNRRGMVFGIDPWSSEIHKIGLSTCNQDGPLAQEDLDKAYGKFWGAVVEYDLDDYINIIRAPSKHVFMKPFFDGKIDILHIDGAHASWAATYDATVFGMMVRKGGFIWVDDTDWASLTRALEHIEMFADCVSDQGTYRLYRVK